MVAVDLAPSLVAVAANPAPLFGGGGSDPLLGFGESDPLLLFSDGSIPSSSPMALLRSSRCSTLVDPGQRQRDRA